MICLLFSEGSKIEDICLQKVSLKQSSIESINMNLQEQAESNPQNKTFVLHYNRVRQSVPRTNLLPYESLDTFEASTSIVINIYSLNDKAVNVQWLGAFDENETLLDPDIISFTIYEGYCMIFASVFIREKIIYKCV